MTRAETISLLNEIHTKLCALPDIEQPIGDESFWTSEFDMKANEAAGNVAQIMHDLEKEPA